MKKEILLLLPAYKREKKTYEILRFYNDFGIDSVVFLQAFSDEMKQKIFELNKNKNKNAKVHIINTKYANAIGKVKKELFMFADSLTNYKFWLLQDNDILMTKEDLKNLLFFANKEYNNFNVFSPDMHDVCKEKDFYESRLCFGCQLLVAKKVKKVYSKLSDIEANEDSELLYLLNNKGCCVNEKFFSKAFKNLTDDTVIDDKIKKLERSALYLKDKYKENCELIYRNSGKIFTRFK